MRVSQLLLEGFAIICVWSRGAFFWFSAIFYGPGIVRGLQVFGMCGGLKGRGWFSALASS